jgi:peptidyl-dipeptidase Dcp
MDFFTRASKSQGAWCGEYRDHRWLDGKEINPVVTIVCNFNNPSNDTPSLLSIDDVRTLFHEFGHGLQGLFSINKYSTTNTAQDIVELPSQIMEHWATEPEVLKMYAKNYKTGEIIPDPLIAKIQNSRFFNTGFDNVELLAASLLDMDYHTLEAPVNIDIEQFEKDHLQKIGLIKEIEPRYRSTYFLHIASDGYDAGYYCYTWAAVLDNDAFEAFREKGIFDKATAESFRKNILAPMGITDAEQSFINFRGRKPVIEPLLKNRGLTD